MPTGPVNVTTIRRSVHKWARENVKVLDRVARHQLELRGLTAAEWIQVTCHSTSFPDEIYFWIIAYVWDISIAAVGAGAVRGRHFTTTVAWKSGMTSFADADMKFLVQVGRWTPVITLAQLKTL